MRRLRLKLLTCLVEIDLLFPKSQRLAIPERHHLHTECSGVEGYRCVDVGYREYEVIQMIDNKFHPRTMRSVARWRRRRSMTIDLVVAIAKRMPVIRN